MFFQLIFVSGIASATIGGALTVFKENDSNKAEISLNASSPIASKDDAVLKLEKEIKKINDDLSKKVIESWKIENDFVKQQNLIKNLNLKIQNNDLAIKILTEKRNELYKNKDVNKEKISTYNYFLQDHSEKDAKIYSNKLTALLEDTQLEIVKNIANDLVDSLKNEKNNKLIELLTLEGVKDAVYSDHIDSACQQRFWKILNKTF